MSKLGDKLSKVGDRNFFQKDEVVFMQGDLGEDMHIVLKGKFGVYINSFQDFPLKIAEILPGNFFGEMSVIENEKRSATVISEETSVTTVIGKDNFLLLIEEEPAIALSLIKTLSRRIRSTNESVAKISYKGRRRTDGPDREFSEIPDERVIILPEGHKQYYMEAPDEFRRHTIKRDVLCPVCTRKFSAEVPVFSSLVCKETMKDSRMIHEGFDILWYSIWVCPHCNYANYYSAFSQIEQAEIENLRKNKYEKNVERFGEFPKVRSIESVLKAYYLALHCNRFYGGSLFFEAKTYLRLYWLYSDLGDKKMLLAMAKKASVAYKRLMSGSRNKRFSIEEEIQINDIIAELSVKLSNIDRAIEFYSKNLIIASGEKAAAYQAAVSRLKDLKQ